MYIHVVVTLVSLGGSFVGIFLRLPAWRIHGFFAVANLAAFLGEVIGHDTAGACVNGSIGAANAWVWWNGGGGDGMRRRLRALRRVFRGVRRTAPATAGA